MSACEICGYETSSRFGVCTRSGRCDEEYRRRYNRMVSARNSPDGEPTPEGPPGTLPGLPPPPTRSPRCRYWSAGCREPASTGSECREHARETSRRWARWADIGLARLLAEAQAWRCLWCGKELPQVMEKVSIDHIIPVSRGGTHDEWNLSALHSRCNVTKRDKLTPLAIALAAEHGIRLDAGVVRE